MPRVVASISLLMFLPLLARSAPPVVTAITPRGAPRGQPVEIVVAGKDLGDTVRLVLPFSAKVARLPDAKPNPAQARFQVEIDAAVPLGLYPIQVMTPEGISALQWFVVDSLPQVNETEANQPREQAQAVPFGVTINGQCAGGDVDFFRFPMKKGQRVVLETEAARLGSGVLPRLRLTSAAGAFLVADDTQKLRGDCRLIYQAPVDGDYVIELSDSRYRGAAPAHYRLRIVDHDVIEEVFPLGGRHGETVEYTLYGPTLAQPITVRHKLTEAITATLTAGGMKAGGLPPEVVVGDLPEKVLPGPTPEPVEVPLPIVVNGRLDQKGLAQRVRCPVQEGQKIRCSVEAESLGSYLDAVLRITDPTGKQLALADDRTETVIAGQLPYTFADPQAEVTVPAGVSHLVIEVRDQRGRGGINFGYRLTIEPAVADFEVRQPVSELNVPRGGSAELVVPVLRRGYNGPLQIQVANLPPGLSVQGGQVPEGVSAGVLTLTSQADITDPVQLSLEGTARINGREVRRAARQELLLSKEARALYRSLPSFRVAMTDAAPFAVQGPPAVESVLGYPVNVAVQVRRDPQAKVGAVDVSGAVPPLLPLDGKAPANAPFMVQPGAAAAESATFILTPRANAPAGVMTLLVQGRSKVGKSDVSVVGPAVTLTVKPPFVVEPPAAVELTAGMTAALKGKLQRQPVFQEAIQWKLDGLPKGVTLVKPPAPLSPASAEYQVELKADPKVMPSKANLVLSFSTTIGGAAYNHPPVPVTLEVK